MTSGSEDYYKVLGLSREASAAEIRKAFHRLAFRYHPDRNPTDPSSADQFLVINEAYGILIDPETRKRYDARTGFSYRTYESSIQPYLSAETDYASVKLNEEIELTYAFVGEGRFFRKPELNGFMVTSGPMVSYRNVTKNDASFRETLLTYTICPLITGTIIIPPAHISFEKEKYRSNTLQIQVSANKCFFKEDEPAGDSPLQIKLFKEHVTSSSVYRKTVLHQRIVLVPRSNLAAFYHRTGKIMKIGFAICGMAWALVIGESIIIGFLAGSLLAGINCHIMYKVMGIKSVFYNAVNYSLVKEYFENGYRFGQAAEGMFIDNRKWDFFKSLFV